MNKQNRPLALITLLAFSLLAGCGGPSSQAADHEDLARTHRVPVKVQFWVDRSDSVCADQRARWRAYATQIINSLESADVIEINEISDVTGGAAPIFRDKVPYLSEHPGRTEQTLFNEQMAELSQRLAASLEKVFGGTDGRRIQSTDIFAAFSRYRPDGLEAGRVFFFSDMLHVDSRNKPGKRINMESADLAKMDPQSFVQEMADRYRWTNRTLAGTTVFVVLPDAALCPIQTMNSAETIRSFYDVLVRSLGGELKEFGPSLNGDEL